MVHAGKQVDVDIAGIARKDERDDLPPAILQRLVTASQSRQEYSHAVAFVSLVNEVFAGNRLQDLVAQRSPDRGNAGFRKSSQCIEPSDHRLLWTIIVHRRHYSLAGLIGRGV